MTALAAVVGLWLAHALTLSVVMARRGHDPFQWALLGGVLGPLAIPLAFAHRERVVAAATPAAQAEPGRVLVAIRPGAELDCVAGALDHLRSLAGPVPVALAAVLDADACDRANHQRVVADTERLLDQAGSALVEAGIAQSPFERHVLYGDPAAALAEFAASSEATLVVVGAGERITRRVVHGSTRSRLLGKATVPVLCVAGAPS